MNTTKNNKRPASSSAESPAQSPTNVKKKRVYSSATKKAKLESDRRRQLTRINIGDAFEQWKTLRESLGIKKDQQLASFLLKCYERHTLSKGPLESTPHGPSAKVLLRPRPPASVTAGESDRDDLQIARVESLAADQGLQSLEKRIKIEEDGALDPYDSDYVPPISLHYKRHTLSKGPLESTPHGPSAKMLLRPRPPASVTAGESDRDDLQIARVESLAADQGLQSLEKRIKIEEDGALDPYDSDYVPPISLHYKRHTLSKGPLESTPHGPSAKMLLRPRPPASVTAGESDRDDLQIARVESLAADQGLQSLEKRDGLQIARVESLAADQGLQSLEKRIKIEEDGALDPYDSDYVPPISLHASQNMVDKLPCVGIKEEDLEDNLKEEAAATIPIVPKPYRVVVESDLINQQACIQDQIQSP